MVRFPYRWLIFAVFIVLCGSGVSAADTASDSDFLPVDQAFSYTKEITDSGRVKLHWSVAPGYYLYRSRLEIEGEPSSAESVQKPSGKMIHDQFFGDEKVFKKDFTTTIEPGDAQKLKLTWQGCAEKGLCYPPQHATIDLPETGAGGGGSQATTNASNTSASPSDQSSGPAQTAGSDAPAGSDRAFAARLAGGHITWTLAVFFGLGLLLAFTPCVLPMVPILSGVVVGAGARGWRGLTLSLAFVLPMALTYAVLGVAAALAGANLQAALQTPAVLGVFAAVFVFLALAMFGMFELQLPGPIRERLNRASANRSGGHLGGAAALGVISAVLVGPCMTAPLAGALLYIANTGNALLGGLALLCLGLGMGVPLLIVGSAGAQLLPKPGTWMNAVKAAFGFVLLATALWLISRVTPDPIMLGLWGALLLAVGVTLWQTTRRDAAAPGATSVIAATVGLLIGLWGALMVVGAAGGAQNPLRPLAFLNGAGASSVAATDKAQSFNDRFETVDEIDGLKQAVRDATQNGQWTVVDFYADWCVSCKVIDKQVFGDPKVQQTLADAKLLRPDVTEDNADSRQLMQTLGVVGPPTILFIGPDGKARRSARVVGELSAAAFLDHWRRARDSSEGRSISEKS